MRPHLGQAVLAALQMKGPWPAGSANEFTSQLVTSRRIITHRPLLWVCFFFLSCAHARLWEKGGLKDGDEEGGGMDGAAAAPGQGMSDGAGEGGDVVVAADVLVYFGNLSPFLAAAAAAVRSRQVGLDADNDQLAWRARASARLSR